MRVTFRTVSKAEVADFSQWRHSVESAAERATSTVLHQIEAAAKDVAAGQFHGVGRLAGSIKVRKSGKLSGMVGPTVIYGRIQELGGPIFPKGHPYLAFYWPEAPPGIRRLPDGRVLVRHVTIPARPYLKPGVEMVKPTIGAVVAAEVEKATAV